MGHESSRVSLWVNEGGRKKIDMSPAQFYSFYGRGHESSKSHEETTQRARCSCQLTNRSGSTAAANQARQGETHNRRLWSAAPNSQPTRTAPSQRRGGELAAASSVSGFRPHAGIPSLIRRPSTRHCAVAAKVSGQRFTRPQSHTDDQTEPPTTTNGRVPHTPCTHPPTHTTHKT